MVEITVTVTGTPPNGSYSSSSPSVQSNGSITVNPGTTTINFSRGSGEAWSFVSPWIVISPSGGPFSPPLSPTADLVSIEDQDPGGASASFQYTLYTSEGSFDPEIINKGQG